MDRSDEYYLASMIQDVGNNVIAANTKKADRKYAKKESELAYSRSMDHWYQTNQYNSPKEQMKRFSDAGLNPNLIYGNMANTPASSSVQYQGQKSDRTLPGMKTDNSRFLNADIQQQSVNQQITMQGKLLEQQVRMNDQILQNMEIKNTNMEADTVNKSADYKNKLLKNIADSLNIKYQYGIDSDGKKTDEGLKDYELSYKDGMNQKLAAEIKLMLQKKTINERLIWWADLKQKMMEDTKTNIDKDGSIERKLSGVVGEAWEFIMNDKFNFNGKLY